VNTGKHRRRWLRLVAGTLTALLVGWIGLLAFPQVLCPNRVRAGSILLHYDDMPRSAAEQLVQSVVDRLESGGYYDSIRTVRVFVFQSPARYALITRLAGIPGEAQGFNLSLLRNTFISSPRVNELGVRTGRRPRYSVWEGDLEHTVAHEIAHQFMVDRVGRRKIPQWKQEGLPEYVANIGPIRRDSSAHLLSRLRVLDDHRAWRAADRWERRGWDRIHYEAGLLVEFLIDIRGYAIEDVVAESVTLEDTRVALRSWAAAQFSPPSEP